MAQIKALFEKTWETINGNCDTLIFLGGNEQSTQKYISEQMGKMTLYKKSHGETKGKQGSSSTNEDTLGRELMLPEEIRKMKRDECIILINGIDPIKDKKIDTLSHPLYDQLVKSAKNYSFDGRIERARRKSFRLKGLGSTTKKDFEDYSKYELLNASQVNQLKAMDEMEQKEYETELKVSEITGEKPPEKPRKRVVNFTLEDLMSLDLENMDNEDVFEFDESLIEKNRELHRQSITENNGEKEIKKIDEYIESNITIKKKEIRKANKPQTFSNTKEALIFLKLRHSGYEDSQIKQILRLVRVNQKYPEEKVMEMFNANMDSEVIESLVNAYLET